MAILLSVVIHAVVLFGINFKLPATKNEHASIPLEVVLVNSKSVSKPRKADALAQANLDGGGNTDSNRRAKTPVPLMPKPEKAADAAAISQQTEQLEQEATRLMTAVNSEEEIRQAAQAPDQLEQDPKVMGAGDLMQRSLEIARLEAQTARDYEAYQKRPKRKFIGARTQEYRFARYVEDWRIKVERIGNLNYPEAAEGKSSMEICSSLSASSRMAASNPSKSTGRQARKCWTKRRYALLSWPVRMDSPLSRPISAGIPISCILRVPGHLHVQTN